MTDPTMPPSSAVANGASAFPPVGDVVTEHEYTDRDRASEVGHLRAMMVAAKVERRINHRDGDVSIVQIEAWEREEYRKWRETWPALNSLLIPHGPAGGAP